jgi:heat shock protein HslJ
MMRKSLVRVLLATSLLVTIPAATAAQDQPAELEGAEWHLTSYSTNGDLMPVPWQIDATLLLEGGSASGSNGCNTFNGNYTTADDTLAFGDAFATTRRACAADAAAVEQGYMANLADTATWTISDAALQLADGDGAVILEFETDLIGLTASDILGLATLFEVQQAEIDRLKTRVDNTNVPTLRTRIRQLESQVKTLRGQVQTLRSSAGSGGSSGVSFSAAEKILLEGVPKAIKSTCTPRRSDNPAGTLAAVQCKPDTAVVRDMAYYLMNGTAAANVFGQRMDENGVADGPGRCRNGVSVAEYEVPGPGAQGCYINADGRANLRIVQPASGCNQLKVGSKTVRTPAIYAAVLGSTGNIRQLARWAEPQLGADRVTREIKRPNMPISPRCPT